MGEETIDRSIDCVLPGTTALTYVIEEFPRVLLRTHLETILRALVEVGREFLVS